ncbi:MAG: TolC family protein [Dehalococcoidia bacterium]
MELMFGWTVPLTGRLRMQDDVNAVRASLALVEAAGVERTEYLSLRGELLAVMMWVDALQASEELLSAAEASVAAAQTAAEAGAATKLDVGLLELEAAGQRAEIVEAEEGRIRAAHAVAQRIGMSLSDAASVYSAGIPPLPEASPGLQKLRQLAVEQHPRLATLRAEYSVAERELRLEMARRYPDLGIGLGFEDEVEDQILGLPLGIEIPLYDRNQQGIAQAYARRCQLRQEFGSLVIEIYGRVEASRARVDVATRRLRAIAAQFVPAEEVKRLAEQMRDEAGGLDMLRFLEVLRATRRVRMQVVEARLDAYEAWTSLEEACGSPLLVFPQAP